MASGCVRITVVAEKVGAILHDTAEIGAKLTVACQWKKQEDIEMIVERETADSIEVTKFECDAYVDGGSGGVRLTCLVDDVTETTIGEILGITELSPTPKSWSGSVTLTGKKFQFLWYYHQDTKRKYVYTLNRKVHLKV